MPTVTKAFSFTNSTLPYTAEGGTWTVVDGVATVGSIVAAADAPTDPSASVFGLQESCSGKNKTNAGNYWQWAGTWEDLGVPSGAGWVVSSIVVTQAWRCSTFTTGAATGNNIGPTELRDSGGTLLAQGTQTAFTAATAFADRSSPTLTVPASSGASTTSIQIRLGNDLATGNSTSAIVTLQQDYVRVDVTYGLPATVTPATLAAVTTIPTPNIPASATATPSVLAAVTSMGAVTPTGGGGGGTPPSVRAAGTLTIVSVAGTSYVLNVPAGAASGDIMYASITLNSHASFVAGQEFGASDSGVPAGWTKVHNLSAYTTANFSMHVFRKVAGASEPSTYTWTAAQSVTGSGDIIAIQNADTALDGSAVSGNVFDAGSTTGGNITTTVANDLLISVCGIDSSSTNVTGPAGFTERWGYTGAVGQRNACGTLANVAISTTTITWTTAVSGLARGYWAAALKPAPGGGGATTTPATLAAVTAMPAVTTGVSSTVTPATIACTATMPAATATMGAVATPAKITCLVGFGAVKRLFAFSGLTGTITGLQASSSYQVTIRAVDTSGNRSADSAPVTVTTTAPGTTVTPATLAAVTTIPTPTVTAGGSATASPATLAATTTVGAPTLHAGWTVTAAPLAATTTIPAVTIGAGAGTSPATLAAITAIGSPTVTVGGVRQPATLAAVTAIPAVSAGGSAQTSPAIITAITAFGAPTVTIGGARQPATITAITAIPAAAVGGSAQATPATIVTTATIGAAVLHAGATVSAATIACTTVIPAATVSGGASSTRNPATIATVTAVGAPAVSVSGSRSPATIVAITSIGAPSLIFGAAVLAATIAARVTMPAPVIQVKIVYRPYTGTTSRPGSGTTTRPFAGTTSRP